MHRKIRAHKPPRLQQELVDQELRRLLGHLLGGSHWFPVVVCIAFLVSLGWLSDSLFNTFDALLRWLILGQQPGPDLRVQLALMIPFLLLIGWFFRRARHWRERLRFRVISSRPPRPARALVIFLSELNRDRDSALASYEKLKGDLSDSETRAQVQNSWRMPIEALASHRETLEKLIVLTSRPEEGKGGSHFLLPKFLGLVNRLWPDHGLQILTSEDFLPSWKNGVDFLDLERQVQVLDTILQTLVSEGLRPHEIVIDITGGTKLSTAAGQAVALAEGRRFQYVFTKGYEVVDYEASYLEEPAG